MSIKTQRFDWKGATREEAAAELLRRNIKRFTTKDSHLPCYICGAKHIRRHNFAYSPSTGTSGNNRIAAHADCVERVVRGEQLKIEGERAKQLSKSALSGGSVVLTPTGVTAGAVELVAELERLSGWHEGVKFAMGASTAADGDSAAWLAGWKEGVKFVQRHKAS